MPIPFTVNDQIFYDSTNGQPLANGNAYFGEPYKDPIKTPKQPYGDSAFGTAISAAQALTAEGKISGEVHLNGDYSVAIYDSSGVQQFLVRSTNEDFYGVSGVYTPVLIDGIPVAFGDMYFGVESEDPLTNPKNPYYDKELQIPAPAVQKLTSAGMLPYPLFFDGSYSQKVITESGATVVSETSVPGIPPPLPPGLPADAVDIIDGGWEILQETNCDLTFSDVTYDGADYFGGWTGLQSTYPGSIAWSIKTTGNWAFNLAPGTFYMYIKALIDPPEPSSNNDLTWQVVKGLDSPPSGGEIVASGSQDYTGDSGYIYKLVSGSFLDTGGWVGNMSIVLSSNLYFRSIDIVYMGIVYD